MEKQFDNSKVVWITWENQIRNHSMAKNIGIDLHQFVYSGGKIYRYACGIMKTIVLLVRLRPNVVFSQNPSIVLNILLFGLKIIFRYKHVIDAHYFGVLAVKGNKILQKCLDCINRYANLVIVTNRRQCEYIKNIGGKSLICEDPLPQLPKMNIESYVGCKNVFFICSYDEDEPYKELFRAANKLSREGFIIYATGNYKKRNINVESYPEVHFLGYITYELYAKYLYNASIAVDLTNYEDCIVCGAYEAMEAEKPLVTSDSIALREYFTAGTIFTKNDSESIYNSIITGYENKERLVSEIKVWKKQEKIHIQDRIEKIKNILRI